jgi:hypothetical protein
MGKCGAPGEIRTPDLLVRSRCVDKNKELTANAVTYHELPLTTSHSSGDIAFTTIRIFSSGLQVGTKLGTINSPLCEGDSRRAFAMQKLNPYQFTKSVHDYSGVNEEA